MNIFTYPEARAAYLSGFRWILELTAIAAVSSLFLGTVLASMRVSPVPALRAVGKVWVNLFRNTPLTLVIFFCYFGLFATLGMRFSHSIEVNNFWLGVVGLTSYTSAFVCEAIRAGINTVPAGELEAARAIGFSFPQLLWSIALPQALRSVIAPMGSILIALCKNTTIVGTIGVIEASTVMKDLINANGAEVIPIFAVFAGTFAIILIPLGYLFNWLGKRLEVKR